MSFSDKDRDAFERIKHEASRSLSWFRKGPDPDVFDGSLYWLGFRADLTNLFAALMEQSTIEVLYAIARKPKEYVAFALDDQGCIDIAKTNGMPYRTDTDLSVLQELCAEHLESQAGKEAGEGV